MIVSTPDGPLVADRAPRALVARGVRFADAPRLAPPVPVAPWTDPIQATRFGPQAPQLPSILDQMLGSARLAQAEDCLSLNVWAPAEAQPGDGLPVLVWIHGGAFTNGTGAAPWYDGSAFADAGCILVTLNYRLGVLGFTHLAPSGRGAEDLALTGNLGILDQIEALRWVGRNIRSFGGDPDNVTVFGVSAGGTSVLALMAIPTAAGLFQRAWAMSPSMTQLRSLERATEAGEAVLAALGLTPATADQIRSLPLEAILEAQRALLRDPDLFTLFGPTPDGQLIPEPVAPALVRQPVPLVLGTMRDEMNLFAVADPSLGAMDEAGLLARVRPWLGDGAAPAVAAYRDQRPGATPGQIATAIATDQAFRAPATRLAERRGEGGSPTWLYWFTWASPTFGGLLGACHGLDVPFVFHTLEAVGVEILTGQGADRRPLADQLHGALVAYARDGSVGWPRYEPPVRSVRRFDVPAEVLEDPERGVRACWPAS